MPLLLLVLALACASCAGPPPARHPIERSRVAMGSQLRVLVWTTSEATAGAAIEQVFREFDRLESLLSVWKPGSDVVRINDAAGREPVVVGRDTIAVLEAAAQASEWTGGKFDITFGALADVWKFDHDQDSRVPDQRAIAARLSFVDYRLVQVDRAAGTAFIRKAGTRIHLGGIGKGYAVDRAAAILRERGFADFLIQSGGDLYVAGRNGLTAWTLGIADPRGPAGQTFATVEIGDGTLSTSGDYERFFVKDGVRYHHLIDPDSGAPATGARSVTIVTDSAMLADVLSTGVFILGPAEGMALVERLPRVEGVIVTAANQVLVSSGLKGRLTLIAPPTDAP
ncbi:MAG: FAD:protein FMN transferase [Acidobacteriota bacterium]|nr:FAD:protein FMN transferase [Acidobacteriota bacterium]